MCNCCNHKVGEGGATGMLTAPAVVGRVVSSSMSAQNDSYLVSVVNIIMFIISSKSLCRTKQS